LDEPTAVLTPQEVESLFTILRKLRNEGHSIIIITHHIDEVLELTDRITVLRAGAKVGEVLTSETDEEQLSRLMVGHKLQKAVRGSLPYSYNKDALVLDSVEIPSRSFGPLSLTLKAGAIVGIAGVDGNGQKALAEVILGIQKIKSGTISFYEKDIKTVSVRQRKDMGFGYISDDRLLDSLVLDMDLTENMLLCLYREAGSKKGPLLDYQNLKEHTQKAVDDYSIKCASLESPVRYLSGGNQQKLILARELRGSPKVVVACQPTRGLDIGSTEEVHKVLLRLRQEGCAVVLISSDLEEILDLSDTISVLYRGKIVDSLPNESVDLTYLGLLMAGSCARRMA
ncbi:MAG: ATP-binding cassette domain-containing protein, partial [Spirochaetia bacterium]|nr:ATP-binding cassette domain-containing protein [Spirochaetia bacterium]